MSSAIRRGRVGRAAIGVRMALILFLLSAAGSTGCQHAAIVRNPMAQRPPQAPPIEARGWADVGGDPVAAFEAMERKAAAGEGNADLYLTMAALADRIGRDQQRDRPGEALRRYRDAAAYAWFAAEEAATGPESGFGWSPDRWYATQAIYNRAVERCLRLARADRPEPDRVWPLRLRQAGIVPWVARENWSGLQFDALWIARDYAVMGLEPTVDREGWGVPVIADRERGHRRSESDRFAPPSMRLAATAVLRPEGPPEGAAWRRRPVSMVLYDPVVDESIRTASGIAMPMAADLSTPLAHQLARAPLPRPALEPESDRPIEASETGLYLPRPFERGKVPVVFVQEPGWTPIAWLPTLNAMMADPELRSRCQFWLASCPPEVLRHSLDQARQTFNPNGDDPAFDRLVVVGYNVGGLAARPSDRNGVDPRLQRAAFADASAPDNAGPRPTIGRAIVLTPPPPRRDGRLRDRMAAWLGTIRDRWSSARSSEIEDRGEENRGGRGLVFETLASWSSAGVSKTRPQPPHHLLAPGVDGTGLSDGPVTIGSVASGIGPEPEPNRPVVRDRPPIGITLEPPEGDDALHRAMARPMRPARTIEEPGPGIARAIGPNPTMLVGGRPIAPRVFVEAGTDGFIDELKRLLKAHLAGPPSVPDAGPVAPDRIEVPVSSGPVEPISDEGLDVPASGLEGQPADSPISLSRVLERDSTPSLLESRPDRWARADLAVEPLPWEPSEDRPEGSLLHDLGIEADAIREDPAMLDASPRLTTAERRLN